MAKYTISVSLAAAELITAQVHHIATLRESGAFVLETLPGQISSEVINQYLDLKAGAAPAVATRLSDLRVSQ